MKTLCVLKKAYLKRNLLFLFLLFFTLSGFSQNNNYLKFSDEIHVAKDSCLTNKTNYEEFELKKTNLNLTLEGIKIRLETLYQKKEFESLDDFNNFDMKLWLLTNESFKSNSNLNIRISYIIERQLFEQRFSFCLYFIDDRIKSSGRGKKKSPDYVKLPVFFGTDRNYKASESPNNAFGISRSKLSYGVVEVSIPHDHRVGEIETPSLWKFEFYEDPSKHIMLHKISLMDKKAYFSELAKDIQTSKRKSTFLFVHGYNTSFSEAAKRTAQISYDLKFEGKAVFYSWPSQASTIFYRKDEKNIAWSQKNIESFLEDYLSITEAEEVYLIAHSMGNRGLTKAIIEVMKDKPHLQSKIKEIILAAPDIDADVFKTEIAPQMVLNTKKPITLYVSADDLALQASKLLNGEPRAGDVETKPIIVNGIETIDATGIVTDFVSHSYFADSSSIISDIFNIIETGKRALERQGLKIIQNQNEIYFLVKP